MDHFDKHVCHCIPANFKSVYVCVCLNHVANANSPPTRPKGRGGVLELVCLRSSDVVVFDKHQGGVSHHQCDIFSYSLGDMEIRNSEFAGLLDLGVRKNRIRGPRKLGVSNPDSPSMGNPRAS